MSVTQSSVVHSFLCFQPCDTKHNNPRMIAIAGFVTTHLCTGARTLSFVSKRCIPPKDEITPKDEVNHLDLQQNTLRQLVEDSFRHTKTHELRHAPCANTTDPVPELFNPYNVACAELWKPILEQLYCTPAAVTLEPDVTDHAQYTRIRPSTGTSERLFCTSQLLRPIDPMVGNPVGNTVVYVTEVVCGDERLPVQTVATTWAKLREQMRDSPQFLYVPPDQPMHPTVMDEWFAREGWTKTGFRKRAE